MTDRKSEYAKRHPIVIALYIAVCVVWTMIIRHPVPLLLSLAASGIYCVILNGIRSWCRELVAGIVMLFFAAVILPLFSHRGVTPLFYINGMAVTWESVYYGLIMTVMLMAVLQWCRVAGSLIDSEKILYLTGKTLPSIGLMLMMIFRTIPLLRERYRQIHEAQTGLGMAGGDAPLAGRIRRLLRELSVMISWTLEDSIEVSVSMESRGYRTGKRTWFHLFHFQREDLYWCLLIGMTFAGMYICQFRGEFAAYYFPEIYRIPLAVYQKAALIMGTIGMLAPAVYDLYFSGREKCTINGTDGKEAV